MPGYVATTDDPAVGIAAMLHSIAILKFLFTQHPEPPPDSDATQPEPADAD